jgi:hypothetical protein
MNVMLITVAWLGRWRLDFQDRLRLVLIKRGSAFSAKIIGGPKLDQMTMVATYYFPGIHRRKCCSHFYFSEWPEQAAPKSIQLKPTTEGSLKHYFRIVNGNFG